MTMERKQYFTTCKHCGKQILMTRNIETGRFIVCNPEIRFFEPGGEDPYITPDGQTVMGKSSNRGEIGYRKHSITCEARRRS